MTYASAKAPPRAPKRPTRWRDLTDEQRWESIYAGRRKRAGEAISSLKEGVSLALPPYALHMAIEAYAARTGGSVRHDAHKAVVGSIALVASRLKEKDRDNLSDKLESMFGLLKTCGFFLDDREFLYAVSVALVKLADDFRYPADSPAVLAAILIKEDAEIHDNGEVWGLSESHATRMARQVFDTFIAMDFYGHIK